MDSQTTTDSTDQPTQSGTETSQAEPQQIQPNAAPEAPTNPAPPLPPTKAKIMFEQVVLFELDPDEARDTEYVRKLIEPHYSAATDAKFESRQEGDCLIVTMIKQNPPKG